MDGSQCSNKLRKDDMGVFTERLSIAVLAVICSLAMWGYAQQQTDPSGEAAIHGQADKSEIVIKTTSRLAGAIDSLTWGGMEFINSYDHGRQLQTAWNLNAGISPIAGETFNPTEAGSRDDGVGSKTSSKLLKLHAHGNILETSAQPAFWLAPGEKSGGKPARNKTVVSDHLLSKHITIGYKNWPHAIDYHVTISIPATEHHTQGVFEALTGYMPPAFEKFWTLDEKSGQLQPLDDGPGEQPHPIVFSTADGSHAMGVWSPSVEVDRGEHGPSYGRWKFKTEKVTKWNCVYRLTDPKGLGGDYKYHLFVAVGSLEDVRATLAGIMTDTKK